MIRTRKIKAGISIFIFVTFKPDCQWSAFVYINTYACKVCCKWNAIFMRFKVVTTIDLHQRCIVTIFCTNKHLYYLWNPWIMVKVQIGHL